MRGGGTQSADFLGFGGGTGRTFGFGSVLGGTFFVPFSSKFPDSGSSLPLNDVRATSIELSKVPLLGLKNNCRQILAIVGFTTGISSNEILNFMIHEQRDNLNGLTLFEYSATFRC